MKLKKLAHGAWRFLKSKKHQKYLKIIVVVFVLLNIPLAVFYNGRAYPWTTVGQLPESNQSFSKIKDDLNNQSSSASTINVVHQDTKASLSPDQLGLKINSDSSLDNIRGERSWLPVVNLFRPHHISVAADFNEKAYSDELNKLKSKFYKPAVEPSLVSQGAKFIISDPSDGFELNETKFRDDLVQAYISNASSFTAPVNILKPKISKDHLNDSLKKLQAKADLDIRLKFQDKDHKASIEEIGNWFEISGTDFKLSAVKIGAFVDAISGQFGVKNLSNKAQAVEAIMNGLNNNQAVGFNLEVPLKVTYKYCVGLKGVDNSVLGEFKEKVSAVYADGRSWNLGGKIRLTKVDSGCDYTIWLSAADQMPSFGGVCDANYSCQSGSNVVVNYDRWRYTTEAWKGGGGSLDDYRSMVINHETGHWLGFGHLNCSGPGQLAPVMQQQSINLQGCKFNPWPTQGERNTLDART